MDGGGCVGEEGVGRSICEGVGSGKKHRCKRPKCWWLDRLPEIENIFSFRPKAAMESCVLYLKALHLCLL